ncbi:FAD:protein FMN transferase [Parasporobacterium paucivorans]|uniref:FAD:protein FMN transferase n=1 Tax=Parasporobacterium paucivorans DSM 15970 TaxID=1122934 RepID=A0A1M6L3C0_9FIRM|nr:FAD:protein FMN transferase [Parasporobacterium paucivorans]SHJ65634.1 thiamine biosynthesis lipoprotein [Parasporobacterium paucivorans DSM 15970]
MTNEKNMQTKFYALGTLNYINMFNCADIEILDKVTERIYEIDDVLSAFKNDSDISKINNSAGRDFVDINKDTYDILEHAIHFSKLSSGCFDVTIGPLVKLWGIGKKTNYIPDDTEIAREMNKVDYRDILLDKVNIRATLRCEDQSIDLGGIAKGYAADEAKRILMENGVKHALINLGGNIVTLGTRVDGTPWKIGIQNPLMQTGQYIGVLSLEEKTIVTSGTNERFFIKDGIRYHHIIDRYTGYPSRSGLLSVTAVCDNSMYADALTTSLFTMGVDEGLKLLELIKEDAIFITDKMEVIMTNGLLEKFKITNTSIKSKRAGFYGN